MTERMVSSILVVDTETTGIDPAQGHTIVEVAGVGVYYSATRGWMVGQGRSSLVAPGRRIPPGARAVHHIGNEEVREAPHIRGAIASIGADVYDVVAAHNADFDRGFIGAHMPNAQWLCTWRCSLHLYPELETRSNQALRYALPDVDAAFKDWCWTNRKTYGDEPLAPHRALYDAACTAHVLAHMLKNNALEHLLVVQDEPVLQTTCKFGSKHRGWLWSDIPKDYLRWILRADPPFDRDVQFTARHYLGH